MSTHDLTELLASWPYEPGRINARQITGADGRPKLQIRLDLGVLQMEMDERPDGARPEGFESLLEYQLNRRNRYARQTGSAEGFVVSSDECRALREEAVQYYHRYVGLFAIGEYGRVVRDALRNLKVFDLCRDCGETPSDRTILEQFRPAVIMMRTRADAELAFEAQQPKRALEVLDGGLAEIRAFYEEAGAAEAFHDANEVKLLRGMRDALVPKLPASQRAELEERLQAAIAAENFELAAILRDELRMLGH